MVAENGNMAMMAGGAGDIAAVVSRRLDQTNHGIAIAMSRIDDVAEAIGGATADLEAADLAHGSVVSSTVASGGIVNIDASAALRVKGVVSILTHQNLPDIVDDHACGDGMIRSGLRLLHDEEILFKGQPVALVVACTPEIARFAASLVRVEYERRAHVADVHLQCDAANDHYDPMEPGASTAIFESPCGISVRDAVYGAQSLRRYLRGRLGSGLRPQVQVMLAARAALALQCSVRVVLTLQQMRDLASAPWHAPAR
jgi:xanthine dehydrogenase YagR molybdenum-binding subunit